MAVLLLKLVFINDIMINNAGRGLNMRKIMIGTVLLIFFSFKNTVFAEDPAVYVVAIPGVASAWVGSVNTVRDGAVAAAKQKYLRYYVVDSLASFINLVENPPPKAIVVNCHGEAIPWDGSTEGTISGFITKIANNVIHYTWRFVTVSGYPFYYWASGGTLNTIGPSGLSSFLSTAGYSASSGGAYAETGNQLLLGEWLETIAGTNLPSSISFSRPLTWTTGFPEFVFYAGKYEGISAKKMGRGYYVHSDGSQLADYDKGYIATLVAYLTLFSPPKTYFAINIPNAPSSWSNADTVCGGVEEALRRIGKGKVNLIPVDHIIRLKSVAENPPLNAKVINCHGENIPWDGDLRGGADDNAGCLNWISLLGRDTAGYGWEFIHISGYPFYRCSKNDNTTVLVGGNGISTFFSESAYSASIKAVVDEIYMKQSKVESAEAIFGYSFPASIGVDRPIQVTGGENPVICAFYSKGTGWYGSARFIFGTGTFLFIEGSGVSHADKGRMGASFSYVLCEKRWREVESAEGMGCNTGAQRGSEQLLIVLLIPIIISLTFKKKAVSL